ncbi:MAG: carbohydrate ABC transporter permease [Candidatus Omnitrophica bacterium]|nr:carbohydrate ABC transporter permease [Candidatus Omnitrophota bacterium]
MSRFAKPIAVLLVILIFVALFLFPLYILLRVAIGTPEETFSQRPPYLLHEITFAHFKDLLASGKTFFEPLGKSIITALLASAASLLIAIPAAYGISKLDYRLRYILVIFIFVSRMVPEVSIALPIAISFIKFGLFDTIPGLVLAHLIRILPVSCFILVGVFSNIPQELEKQARIDGASRMAALRKVVLPLSMGGIGVAGMFSFLLSWDEFIYASYLCLARPTMPLKMFYYISRGDIFSSATYAAIITIPVLIVTFALQKYLKPDYLAGAIKG